jgi:hypothetical protein
MLKLIFTLIIALNCSRQETQTNTNTTITLEPGLVCVNTNCEPIVKNSEKYSNGKLVYTLVETKTGTYKFKYNEVVVTKGCEVKIYTNG